MKDKERIHRICLHIRKIMQYCQDTTYDTFSANDMLVEACVFNLSQRVPSDRSPFFRVSSDI